MAAYQQIQMVPIFPFVMYNSGRLSAFPCYLKLVLLAYVKSGSHLLPMLKKSFVLMVLLERWQTSTAPSVFPAGDVSGKVWSTLITTQQERIYPKSSFGFATYTHENSLPIYWRIALRVYSPCTNILALRVLRVKITNFGDLQKQNFNYTIHVYTSSFGLLIHCCEYNIWSP